MAGENFSQEQELSLSQVAPSGSVPPDNSSQVRVPTCSPQKALAKRVHLRFRDLNSHTYKCQLGELTYLEFSGPAYLGYISRRNGFCDLLLVTGIM